MYRRPVQYEGIPETEFIRLPEDASLEMLVEALEAKAHWSGTVVETARFVLLLDDYVREVFLEERYGPNGPDEAIRMYGSVGDASLALRARTVAIYGSIAGRLPSDALELRALNDSLLLDLTSSARRFVQEVARASARLVPPWTPAGWSDRPDD